MPSVLKVNEIQSDTSLPLVFNVGNAERGRIDTSGNMMLGATTARANFSNSTVSPRLQVEGTSSSTSALSAITNTNDAGESFLYLAKSRGTTIGSTTVVQNGDRLGNINFQGSDGTEFVTAAAIYAVVDGAPGANDMPGALVFQTTADGAAGPTERARFNSTGAFVFAGGTTSADGIGITFPATQSASTNANTLDDYEEGTFTATLTPGTSGSITLNSIYDLLSYTKIGRLVTITGQLVVSSVSSPVGSLVNLNNLPFPCADISELSERAGGCTTYVDNSTNLIYTQGMLLAASDTFARIYMTESGRVAAIAADDGFIFSFSYITS